MRADNQQERLDSYIAGFVDGEGCFHVAVQKIVHVRFGYQLVPEFLVSQNLDYAQTLNVMKTRFNCGYIKPNHAKNPRDKSYVYVVRDRDDLLMTVIPFFEKNILLSPKYEDFRKFSSIVKSMHKRVHFEREGFISLLREAFSMNRKGIYRKTDLDEIIRNLESSTTIR